MLKNQNEEKCQSLCIAGFAIYETAERRTTKQLDTAALLGSCLDKA